MMSIFRRDGLREVQPALGTTRGAGGALGGFVQGSFRQFDRTLCTSTRAYARCGVRPRALSLCRS
jgi:hypothetical protein